MHADATTEKEANIDSSRVTTAPLEKLMQQLAQKHPFIVGAYQFGSTVRGQEGPLSDVDVAILVDEERVPGSRDLLRVELLLAYALQKALRGPEVDLVTLNRLPLHLQHAILRSGRLLYDADPGFRIHFTQRVIAAYLDFQPTLAWISRFHTQGRLKRCETP